MWVDLILRIVAAGAEYLTEKLKQKYRDKALELSQKLYEENNRPESQRNDALIDNLEFEALTLAQSFLYEAKK